jgi:DNA processing protein
MTDKMLEYIATRAPHTTIVSGLAFGTDSNAHRAALHFNLPTAAVIPAILPEIVPSEHSALARDIVEHGGVILSEFNSLCRPSRNCFVTRNRIIAGVSEGTLVVESKASGGSMSTAEYTLGYNRTLLALPGRATDVTSAGTNRLIVNRQASAVCSGEDIVREMYWDASDPQVGVLPFDEPNLTAEQQRIYNLIPESDPVSVDTLCERCSMGKGELSIILVDLELEGVVRRLPGDCYTRS